MNKVAVVTDSTAYLPEAYLKKYNISTVPLVVIWDNAVYEDGIQITPEQFYTRLQTAKNMPSTSQVTPVNMSKIFKSLLAEGYDVFGVFISGKLSGTIASATQARDELSEAEQSRVTIFDSKNTAMAMGFQAIAAAEATLEGGTLAEVQAEATQARDNSGLFFVVDTLEFLHRGGRIGGAQRLLGSALNLKPILTVADGKIEAVERVRTKAKANDRLIEIVAEKTAGAKSLHLAVMHANSPEEAASVAEKVKARFGVQEVIISELSPVIGTHTGPGTICLAYWSK